MTTGKKKNSKKASKKLAPEYSGKYAKGMAELAGFALKMKKSGADKVEHKYVPFQNLALNIISGGGAFEDRVIEIAGDSQTGKSYLAYELMGSVLQSGGHAYINDNEEAFEDEYGERSGFPDGAEYALSPEKDISKVFREMRAFCKAVRAVDKKGLIVLVLDSYGGLSTDVDMANEEAKKDPRGYMYKIRAGIWNEHMRTFVSFLKKYHAVFVIVNQAKLDKENATQYYKPYKSLAEDVIKFWCTQRLLLLAKGKIYLEKKGASDEDKDKKKPKKVIGQLVQAECIKNRTVEPFQKCTIKMLFKGGIDKYSGLEELLVEEGLIKVGKVKEGKSKVTKYKDLNTKKIHNSIQELIEANPEIASPRNHFSINKLAKRKPKNVDSEDTDSEE